MRKRLVSILMALCMAVSLLPVQALAADDAYTVGEDTQAKVRLYGGSLVPEENCATLTLADGTVTVFIPTEERLQVVLADTSGKYVGGDLTIYQDVAKPLTIHKAAKSITAADGKRVSELIIAVTPMSPSPAAGTARSRWRPTARCSCGAARWTA